MTSSNNWKCVNSIYDHHIIYNDIYISRDDVISINDEIYYITGITDEYNVYLQQEKNNMKNVYAANDFINLLENNTFKYIHNVQEEWMKLNSKYY